MNILFATPECAPMVKTGGLGDVSAALPPALAQLGHDVRILMPAYGHMQVSGEMSGSVGIPAHGPWPAAQIIQLQLRTGVTLLLLSCPQLYARNGSPYGNAQGADHPDNALRFGMLARVAAMLGTPQTPMGWQADVVHANDWPCGLAPLYLRQARQAARVTGGGPVAASVMTIHNMAFRGLFPMDACDGLDIAPGDRGMDGVEFWGQMSMLKAGLQCADAITTVSPTYAREIQTEAHGFGLDGLLRWRSAQLHGILNGIDPRVWNPADDPQIAARYDAGTLVRGKAQNKAALQALCGLAVDPARMLFGVVSRLTEQKGLDLIAGAAAGLVKAGGQLAVLGSGDPALQEALVALAGRHPGAISVTVGFDETLAHLIEAGADCFLMPSRFEPCGLNQMYSQAYGTPPIVANTGGLADSVTDADAEADSDAVGGTGFVMTRHDPASLEDAITRAFTAWREPARWERIQRAGMARDFGWGASARAYAGLYAAIGADQGAG